MVKEIRIDRFDYNLPEEKIPTHPLAKRDACKLLLSRPDGQISHRKFSELPDLLPLQSLLLCNDTKVINARLSFFKESGSRIEIFMLSPLQPADYQLSFQTRGKCVWKCMVGNLKRWKDPEMCLKADFQSNGRTVSLFAKRLEGGEGNVHPIEFFWNDSSLTFATVVEALGVIPIPPYLKRESEKSDSTDYQTVYANIIGSVAAPTAGLHFTQNIIDDINAHNIEIGKLTLHVGAGTFQPVKSDTIGNHNMHTEFFSVKKEVLKDIIKWSENGWPIVAVGTTTVRTLESLPYLGMQIKKGNVNLHVDQWTAYEDKYDTEDTVNSLNELLSYMDSKHLESLPASTSIMIAPGFKWRLTSCLVTNFHQPQSTLLLLVSSFLGDSIDNPQWKKIYESALKEDYRFLSYGDASLLFPIKHK